MYDFNLFLPKCFYASFPNTKNFHDIKYIFTFIPTFCPSYLERPKDPRMIKYLIDITDILRGKVDEDEDPGETLIEIANTLKMSEKDLQMCHRKTATGTARHLMKFFYPNPPPDLKLSKIDKNVIDSIISKLRHAYFFSFLYIFIFLEYTKFSNPNDIVSETDVRHAIGNYIAAYAFKNKLLKNNVSNINT